jgi:Holliday junction resolvase RusA-like endonuclease
MTEYDQNGKRIYLRVWYPQLPPTTNHLYYLGTRLTDEARIYRGAFRQYMQQNYGHQISEMEEPNDKALVTVKRKNKPTIEELKDVKTRNPNLLYGINLTFFMDVFTTWGDPKYPKSQRAKFRFSKTDLSNRVKFVEDCFKYALDLDDSLTFWSSQRKIHNPQQQGVDIEYFVVPPESVGVESVGGPPI